MMRRLLKNAIYPHLMQARHISQASKAIMAFARGRLSPSHEIMGAYDLKTPGGGSLKISLGRRGKFPLPVLGSYFSRLKELGEEGPAHGLCFSVFLSSPGEMFCTNHFNL